MAGYIFNLQEELLTTAVSLFRNVVIEHQSLMGNEGPVLQIVMLSGVYLMIGMVWYKRMEPRMLESVLGRKGVKLF